MADTPILIKPGVSLVRTPLLNEAGISNCNLIRFYGSLLQKKGGWTRLTSLKLQGTCRGLHGFTDLSNIAYVPAGTEQVLHLFSPAIPSAPLSSIVPASTLIPEVTPVRRTSNLNGPFSTQVNSKTVTVADAASGASVGDWIYIATLCYIGGIPLQGLYQVQSLTASGYTITAAVPATATISGGVPLTFTTQVGSNSVQVQLGSPSLGFFPFVAGQSILVYLATTVGGVSFSGLETLSVSGGVASFTANQQATANATVSENGGAVQILYLLSQQADQSVPGAFGVGPFGAGAFGVGSTIQAPAVLREWSIDNFGQIMTANPKSLGIYAWQPPFAYNNRATLVGNDAPQFSTGSFVAMPQEQLISFGSDAGGFLDPMLVRFSAIGDFRSSGTWTASVANQAGSFRLSRGSAIVGGMQSDYGGLIWTDVGLWSMQYMGLPFVYSFREISRGCGLIAMRAAAEVGGLVVWPSFKGFFFFDGQTVRPLECEVWDFLFLNVDPQFQNAISAFPNSDFSEVAWHFAPLGANGVATSYINLNILRLIEGAPPETCWDFGTLTRTAGHDRSAAAAPVGTDGTNGLLQTHETQTDADSLSMPSFAETGWFRVSQGHQYMFVERLFPDFVFGPGGGTVNVTVLVGEYQQDAAIGIVRTFGPFACTPKTQHLIPRCRGRFMKLHFDFSALGTFARVGEPQARMAPAGGR